MCAKSQSEATEGLKSLNLSEYEARKRSKTVQCAELATKRDLIKDYCRGHLSLIFDLPALRDVEVVGGAAVAMPM